MTPEQIGTILTRFGFEKHPSKWYVYLTEKYCAAIGHPVGERDKAGVSVWERGEEDKLTVFSTWVPGILEDELTALFNHGN